MATNNSIGSNKPLSLAFGGLGVNTLTDHGILIGNATNAVTATAEGATGQFLIGTTGAVASWFAAGDAGKVLTTNGVGSALTWETPTTGVVTSIGNGTNTTVTGTAAVPVVDLDADISGMTSITMADTGSIQTTVVDTDTLLIQGYDVDGTAYVPFITITNADDPTCDLNTGVTLGTKYIYRADGTDVPVADGGTGASTFTDGGVLVGATAAAIEALAVGTDGQVLLGSSAANPVFGTLSSTGTIAFTTGAGTLALNCRAASEADTGVVELATDAEAIAGAASTVINCTSLKAKLGTQTDHGVLIGSGTAGAVTALGVGGTGVILQGSAAADPAWSTASYPATAAVGTILIASGANVITTLAPDTAGYVLTDGGAGVAPSWVAPTTGTVTSVTGGTNISTSGTGAAPIIDLDAAITAMTSVTFSTGGSLQTGTIATNSLLIQAYDVDGTAYVPFITLTAADDPTCDLATGVTIGTKYIYRADGTDVPVADGGTGAGSFTDHGVLIGNTTNAITATAEGTDGQVLLGDTSDEPAFGTLTSTGTIAFTPGAHALALNCRAATDAVTGVVELATDAEAIAGGAGSVAIIPTSLKAKLGTQTDHGVLVGSGTDGAITALTVGTDGQVLLGDSADDPVFGTLSSTGTIAFTPGAGTLALNCRAATDAVTGVVELATDAEAIAGGAGSIAIIPTSLKAKLGAQTSHGLPYGAGTDTAIAWTAEPSDGQLLIGDTGNVPQLGTLTAGTGIGIVNVAHSITISSSGTTIKNETGTTYNLILTDQGKFLTCTNASAIAITVPTNASIAFPIGTIIGFQQGGAGQLTFSGAVPPTLKSADDAYTTVKLYSVCCIIKIDTDVWSLGGDLEA